MNDDTGIVSFGDDSARDYSSPRATEVQSREQANEWGGLPAPWEPLPMPEFSPPASAAPTMATPSYADDTPVHFADRGRPAEASPAAAAAPHSHDAAPPPDLDTLARRVYDVLKRRLAAERRREG